MPHAWLPSSGAAERRGGSGAVAGCIPLGCGLDPGSSAGVKGMRAGIEWQRRGGSASGAALRGGAKAEDGDWTLHFRLFGGHHRRAPSHHKRARARVGTPSPDPVTDTADLGQLLALGKLSLTHRASASAGGFWDGGGGRASTVSTCDCKHFRTAGRSHHQARSQQRAASESDGK